MKMTHSDDSSNPKGEFPRIVLAGATGFLGSIVLANLEELELAVNCLPRIPDSGKDHNQYTQSDREIVFVNCIGVTPGESPKTVEEYEMSNVRPLNRIFDIYGDKIKKFVHCSTWLTEEGEKNAYVSSKISAENLVNKAAEFYGFESAVLNLPTIWSKKKYKNSSLLHDICSSNLAISEFQPKNPHSKVKIGTEEFFIDAVLESLSSEFRLDGLASTETWEGKTNDLISNLALTQSLDAAHTNHTLHKLSQIINFWKSVA
jgi:nucleoside-diphosphate-sugar epimerase